MKLFLTKPQKYTKYDITNVVASFTWSGSLEQVSRSVTINMINAPYDEQMKVLVTAALGDILTLYDDSNKLIFYGMIFTREKKSESGTESYTAHDLLFHMTKSTWSRSFKKVSAESIVKACCKEVGLNVGMLPNLKVNITKFLIESDSVYNTMLKVLKKVSKSSGEKYFARMDGKKVFIAIKGYIKSEIKLSDVTNITSADISESAEDIVNRVKIYNDKGKQKGVVSNSASIQKYGVFQTTYTKEKGVNATQAAKNLFVNASQTLTIEAIGDISCLSGCSVEVVDGSTGFKGLYWIVEDNHTFENGMHTMSLVLSTKNTM